ncbi:MAG: glycosyl transferase [Pseudolabrys sp.]
MTISAIILTLAAAAALSAGLILLLRPWLQRHALSHPNHRSSHKVPTPQGGGFGVIGATIAVAAAASVMLAIPGANALWLALAAAAFVAGVGAIDDRRPIDAVPRLILQSAAVMIVIIALPHELRFVMLLPEWLERALLAIALLWVVNAVNFMDGIDWMTVAEIVPVTGALALFGYMGALPGYAALAAAALCGALVGFAPFNRPVAKLFLGDVGSLPVGLLLGWLLILLAGAHIAAALLLPLYYLADATVTLLRRLINGEPVLQAHRSHFYQRAMNRGLSVQQIVGRVFAVNLILAVLALATLIYATIWVQVGALIGGAVLVGGLLLHFEHGKK